MQGMGQFRASFTVTFLIPWTTRNIAEFALACCLTVVLGVVEEGLRSSLVKRSARSVSGVLLKIATTFLSYCLMLLVMSFNIGIILSAVGGLALGHFIFAPRPRKTQGAFLA